MLLAGLAVFAGVGGKVDAFAGRLELAEIIFVSGNPVLPDFYGVLRGV
jgi:hypothetical protein